MDITIRPLGEEEFPAFMRTVESAFSYHPFDDEIALERSVIELDRTLVAVDGGEMVGGASAYSMMLTVPGGTVPMAGVTAVGVRPTHRRRGVLNELMRRQLDDLREEGEAVAGLFASEGSIYGRFGYGVATLQASVEIERERTGFGRPHQQSGRVSLVERQTAVREMPAAYERVRNRPGLLERSPAWWEYVLADIERWRDGATAYFFALHRSGEGVDGYVVYRVKHDWETAPRSKVQIRELVAATPEAYADLWRYCFDIDLIHTIVADHRPADEPLLYMVAEPRRLNFRLGDGLYIRLVDLPRALASRRYASDGRMVLGVRDRFCPWNEGRYELEGGPDGAQCRSTEAEPDVLVDASDLGATYLGGVRFELLARAGRVEEATPGALRRADGMFAWEPAPWCPQVF
jgi:predicted acetyltransferase